MELFPLPPGLLRPVRAAVCLLRRIQGTSRRAFCLGLGRDPTELEMLGLRDPARLREECRGLAGRQAWHALPVRNRPFPLGENPAPPTGRVPGWLMRLLWEPGTPQGGAQPAALVRSPHIRAADWNSKSACSCELGCGGERSEMLARRGRLRDCVCDRFPASLRGRLRLTELPISARCYQQ